MTPSQLTPTLLVELLILLIGGCASYVAWKARQIWHKMDSLTDQVNTNSRILVGKEGEPYDGIVPEVQKNARRLDNHKQLLRRLKQVVERSDNIEGAVPDVDLETNHAPDGGMEHREE